MKIKSPHLEPLLACVMVLSILSVSQAVAASETRQSDICIYGGTAGGVMAAIQAARMGKTVVVVEPGRHLGGMTSGGLGATDLGNKAAVGGLAWEFYHRVARHYSNPDAWQAEQCEAFFKEHPSLSELGLPEAIMTKFEPCVAEAILKGMAEEANVPITFNQQLSSVAMSGPRITEIVMESGEVYRAKMYIDATYEGDLMAKAGVSFTVGRESNAQYNETLNGVCAKTPSHQFAVAVDPYVKPGDPASGLLPFIQTGGGSPGEGDAAVQAYNFRLCYTTNAANRLPHAKPDGYDPTKYELLARYLEALVAEKRAVDLNQFLIMVPLPNQKVDINNRGGFSTDFIGSNYDYPSGDSATRAKIWKAHEDYIRGFFYFLSTSPRVPESLRREVAKWGPAKDEFIDTGGWPHQLYVREARRMISDYVMTEHNCRGTARAEDPIGLASYKMDSHNCRRLVKDGRVENEGDVQSRIPAPYSVSYRSIVPKAAECENLLVPVCVSSTHIAYGSIRMEPVFMVLGQSAATAAALAIDAEVPIQKIDFEKLRARLLADKQALNWTTESSAQSPRSEVLIVDDTQAQITGEWTRSAKTEPFVGDGYLHDDDSDEAGKLVRFVPTLPSSGRYKVGIRYPAASNRASNVPVVVHSAAGEEVVIVNQRNPLHEGRPWPLGTFSFNAGTNGWVEIRTTGTKGHVVADAVQFEPELKPLP